ncbi:MAG TPA: hypothetical protein VF549_12665 [Solirubrobacteraceae bacterium]|jgi:hypothetical protein
MWREALFVVLLLTAGFFEELAEYVPFANAVGLLVAFGVPVCLLIDAELRRRGGAPQ